MCIYLSRQDRKEAGGRSRADYFIRQAAVEKFSEGEIESCCFFCNF